MHRIVVDTDVFLSALRSRRGASYKLLFDVDRSGFTQFISTALVLEYESIAKRELAGSMLSMERIDAIVDMICKVSVECSVSFRWRPYLNDPGDDFILELAVASQRERIITYNKRDFRGAENFGMAVLTPKEFLEILGEIKS